MADRQYVARRIQARVCAWCLVATMIGCTPAEPDDPVVNGRVLDQTSGKPIAGAYVIGLHLSNSGVHAASSCNQIEVAISDDDGRFKVHRSKPIGVLALGAYKPGYLRASSLRQAANGVTGDPQKWQVIRYKPSKSVEGGLDIDLIEPTIYASEREAQRAAGELTNVYLVESSDARRQLADLSSHASSALCGGTSVSPDLEMQWLVQMRTDQARLRGPAGLHELIQHAIARKAR